MNVSTYIFGVLLLSLLGAAGAAVLATVVLDIVEDIQFRVRRRKEERKVK